MLMQNHIFQVWLHVTKEFGLVFAIHQTYLLDYQFCIVESRLDQLNPPLKTFFPVACALDFTFQFDWWLDREAWLNSTLTSSDFVNSTMALN